MKTLIAVRMAIEFVLCVVAWYVVPWPAALLLTILAASQEFQAMTTRRLLGFIFILQGRRKGP